MANEITYQINLLLKNGSLADQFASGSLVANQSSAFLIRNVQTIGTTEESLQLGDITTPGFAVFQNLDATNYVEIGSFVGGTFYPFMKLKKGEIGMCRVGVTAIYAKANTSPVNIFYIVYSD